MPTADERIDHLELGSEDVRQRLIAVERHVIGARVRDATHGTRLGAVEKTMERGFSALTRDIRELRRLIWKLTLVVGSLYAGSRWGPAAVQEARQAFAAPPPAAAATAQRPALPRVITIP